ncbi:hypothetical protein Q8A67_022843 [Cirrhinus molitorella]|uniref:Uncharacterized protein n=1 Tax=Cirrhinus molitorella TaxID=172907 RepID=A0AA88P2J2_9TELE|nr:hypothetical protein Q8A67_022843 [Cirrhinus molitorella]
MEQLQDCVSSKFLMLEKPELIKVCSYLKCSEPAGEGFPGQTRRALIRLAEKTIDEIEEGLEEERYAESLNKLLNFIGSLKEPAEHQTSLVTLAEIEKLRKDGVETQGQREETSMKESIPGKEKKKQVQSKDIGSDTTTKAIEDLRGGQSRVVHINLLLPCDSLPVEKPGKTDYQTQKRRHRAKVRKEPEQQPNPDSDSDEDQGYELLCKFPPRSEQSGKLIMLNPEADPFEPAIRNDNAPRYQPDSGEENLDVTGIDESVPGVSEEEDQESGSEPELSQPATYPQQQRRQPKMLTYDELGEPTVVCRNPVLKEISFLPACDQNLWRPWMLTTVNSK